MNAQERTVKWLESQGWSDIWRSVSDFNATSPGGCVCVIVNDAGEVRSRLHARLVNYEPPPDWQPEEDAE